MPTRANDRTRLISLGLALALLSLGCANWTGFSNLLARSGEIRGHVEALEGVTLPGEDAPKPEFKGGEIIVFIEPIRARFSIWPNRKVQKVAIRTERGSQGIQFVTVDQPFRIQNLDSIHHELFTANQENPLRIRLKGHSESDVLRMASPEFVRFFCALHPDENHTLVVSTGHDYVSVGADSRFRIPNVRAGQYRVRAASVDGWSAPQTVNVERTNTIELVFRLAPGRND